MGSSNAACTTSTYAPSDVRVDRGQRQQEQGLTRHQLEEADSARRRRDGAPDIGYGGDQHHGDGHLPQAGVDLMQPEGVPDQEKQTRLEEPDGRRKREQNED